MKLVIVAMRDSAVNAFMSPLFVPTVGAAVRSFQDAVNGNEAGDIKKHPEDFEMFELGTFDSITGEFDVLEKPRSVARGKDLVRS